MWIGSLFSFRKLTKSTMPPSYLNSRPLASSPLLVGEHDVQSSSQERGLAHPLLERREVELERLEDVGIGQVRDGLRTRRGGRRTPLQIPLGLAALVLLRPREAVAADVDEQVLGEGVDDRHADAVQAAGDLVAAAVAELPAGVEHGQHDLDGGSLLLLHHRDRDPAAVVDDGYGVVRMDRDREFVAVAGERLVDRVVDDLVDEVVQPSRAGRPDVHAGALAHRFEALEDGDVLCVVTGRVLGRSGRRRQSPTILRYVETPRNRATLRRAGAS